MSDDLNALHASDHLVRLEAWMEAIRTGVAAFTPDGMREFQRILIHCAKRTLSMEMACEAAGLSKPPPYPGPMLAAGSPERRIAENIETLKALGAASDTLDRERRADIAAEVAAIRDASAKFKVLPFPPSARRQP